MASWRRGTLGSAFLCIVSCLLATTRPVEATCDVDALFANADAMTNATVDATRAWLHGIASAHHSPVTYAAAYDLLETIDSRDAETVRLAYGGSAPKCREVGAFEGDACVWNREHLWPQSYGVGDSSGLPYDAPPRVDMHALVPSHAALNSARGNRVFSQILDQEDEACAEWSTAWSDGRSCESPVSTASGVVGDAGSASIGGFWQPPSSMKGFVARAMLYMALRYDGDDETRTTCGSRRKRASRV
jgi:serine protease